jgi:hypothetical protein
LVQVSKCRGALTVALGIIASSHFVELSWLTGCNVKWNFGAAFLAISSN